MGTEGAEMEGTNPVVPFKMFWKRHEKLLRAGLLQWQNCTGGRALVTQIMSPALTGKLMAEKNGEWQRLRSSNFSIQISFILLAVVGLSTQRSGNVVTTLSRLSFPCSSD